MTTTISYLESAPDTALVIGITEDDHAALMRSRDPRVSRMRDRDTRRTYFAFEGCPLAVLAERKIAV